MRKFEKKLLRIAGQEVGYLSIGTGFKEVILVHGFGMTGLSWMPLILPFLNDFKFFVIDLPGHGRSYKVLPWSKNTFLHHYSQTISELAAKECQKSFKLVLRQISFSRC